MAESSKKSAVVLLSGGMDSATAIAVAISEGFTCHALSFDYRQRHRFELRAAAAVAKVLGAVDHRIIKIDLSAAGGFGHSALTDEIAVPKNTIKTENPKSAQTSGRMAEIRPYGRAYVRPDGRPYGRNPPRRAAVWPKTEIPITYVPARNTIFLSFALGYAEVVGSFDIFIGVNAIDYSGYPDCRGEYIAAFEAMANLATAAAVQGKGRYVIHAPLIHLTKAQIIQKGLSLGVDYSLTRSCYDPSLKGLACGRCDSCRLRLAGFSAAGVKDPLKYQK